MATVPVPEPEETLTALARRIYAQYGWDDEEAAATHMAEAVLNEYYDEVASIVRDYCLKRLRMVRCQERREAIRELSQPRVFTGEQQERVRRTEAAVLGWWDRFRLPDNTPVRLATRQQLLDAAEAFRKQGYGAVHSGDICHALAERMRQRRAPHEMRLHEALTEQVAWDVARAIRRRDEQE